MDDVLWVDTDRALRDLCDHLRTQSVVGVDTEFHRERTFFPQLALVQVASAERVACIDPLASIDLAPLDEAMRDPSVLKVLHAGRQDLEIFFHRMGEVPAPLFDTQVAAGLLGLGDQVGYGDLVKRVLGVALSKVHVRTDWTHRPLAAEVVAYAADDVRHLPTLFAALDGDLEARGRRRWLHEEQAPLLRPATYRPPDAQAWRRVKGVGRLRGVETAVARDLGAWRETQARRVDRPRRRVLSDEALVDLARQRPRRVRDLERMRSLDPATRRQHGTTLVELVTVAADAPPEDWPPELDRGAPTSSPDGALVDALAAVLSVQAKKAGISPRILAAKRDLERLAAGDRSVPVLAGWRRELAGEALLGFLAGEGRLRVVDGALDLS